MKKRLRDRDALLQMNVGNSTDRIFKHQLSFKENIKYKGNYTYNKKKTGKISKIHNERKERQETLTPTVYNEGKMLKQLITRVIVNGCQNRYKEEWLWFKKEGVIERHDRSQPERKVHIKEKDGCTEVDFHWLRHIITLESGECNYKKKKN